MFCALPTTLLPSPNYYLTVRFPAKNQAIDFIFAVPEGKQADDFELMTCIVYFGLQLKNEPYVVDNLTRVTAAA